MSNDPRRLSLAAIALAVAAVALILLPAVSTPAAGSGAAAGSEGRFVVLEQSDDEFPKLDLLKMVDTETGKFILFRRRRGGDNYDHFVFEPDGKITQRTLTVEKK